MTAFLSIDPGTVHCGLALFHDEHCDWAQEYTPSDLLSVVEKALEDCAVSEIVCEEFRLYPKAASMLAYDDLRTVEVIGVLRWLCSRAKVPFILQPASIKRATTAMVKRRAIELASHGAGEHARDAELHGFYRIWRGGSRCQP
jgi:hypothetical protein